jgi:hypothetical protein
MEEEPNIRESTENIPKITTNEDNGLKLQTVPTETNLISCTPPNNSVLLPSLLSDEHLVDSANGNNTTVNSVDGKENNEPGDCDNSENERTKEDEENEEVHSEAVNVEDVVDDVHSDGENEKDEELVKKKFADDYMNKLDLYEEKIDNSCLFIFLVNTYYDLLRMVIYFYFIIFFFFESI